MSSHVKRAVVIQLTTQQLDRGIYASRSPGFRRVTWGDCIPGSVGSLLCARCYFRVFPCGTSLLLLGTGVFL